MAKEKITASVPDESERQLFYSDSKANFADALVGYLRMDFGKYGTEFWNTWHEKNSSLKDSIFIQEINSLIAELRKNILKNRCSMQDYIQKQDGLLIKGTGYRRGKGFKFETENNVFYLRCTPAPGEYDCYCYGYNKAILEQVLAQEQDEAQGMWGNRTMKVALKSESCELSEKFPKKPLELMDVLDRLQQTGNRTVNFEFDSLPELTGRDFRADIFMLNLFTERLTHMTPLEKAAYLAVLKCNPVLHFEEAVQMTFGLENVPIVKISDFSELGEFALENKMLPEIVACPDTLLPLLDTEKLGRLTAERRGGIFIGAYYCEPKMYQNPNIQIKIGDLKPCVLRLFLTPDEKHPELAGWVSLPCEESELENKVCLNYQSALPNLSVSHRPEQDEIKALNRMAELLSGLNQQDFIKLKAVMEYTGVRTPAGVSDCFSHLSEYDFDSEPQNQNGYGSMTAYGVLSGRGVEQSEIEEEDCEIQMGGISW